MADAEILFNDVTDFGDGLVPFFLIGGQLSTPCSFSNDAILNLVHAQKLPVHLSKIAFICKDFLYGIFGMTTAGDTEGKVGAVMERGRGHFRGQDKAITGCLR